MIGVLSKETETQAVREFFELFKTPWEFYVPHHAYDIVLVTREEIPVDVHGRKVAIYNSRGTTLDEKYGVVVRSQQRSGWLEWDGGEFPVYGEVSDFQSIGRPFIQRKGRPEMVGLDVGKPPRQYVRIGYDLFQEVGFLLTRGQPSENAHIPTLDIHTSILRSVMLSAGIPFVEIPPVPAGYDFMACLTHDVDFTGIREHKFDHTMWGFVFRAIVGSFRDSLRGRLPWSRCAQNWKAVFSLPFVYLGWREDFWLEFDRYLMIEKGLSATYFFLPFKDYPGTLGSDPAPKIRAAKYDVREIKDELHKLVEHECEVGLHGIDSWQDSEKARIESARIRELTGQTKIGVRMHWLYFSEASPKILEQAGFTYDSTFGYNDALGFRGGTTQAFSPLGAEDFLELPLNIQDTAMFYPNRMNLSEAKAMDCCKLLIEHMATFGGALTINWHTRSLSPERLWGDFYLQLVKEIQEKRVWFATAEKIVAWFQRRRALRFNQVEFREDGLHLKMAGPSVNGQPPFLIRVHNPQSRSCAHPNPSGLYSDTPWKGETELKIAS